MLIQHENRQASARPPISFQGRGENDNLAL